MAATPEETALLRLARERYDSGIDALGDNREQQMDDLKFRAGDQWPQGVPEQRESEGRPCLTINQMPQFVRQVTGDIRLNKPAIKVRPVSGGADPDTAETFTGLIRNIEQQSLAQVAYACAADSSATCGIGNFRIDTVFAADDVFEQDIEINRITNPFAVVWDPDAQKITKQDAKWCFVVEELTVAEFRDRYPDAMVTDFDADEPNLHLEQWREGENILIAEYWLKEPTTKILAMLADGRVLDITDIPDDQVAVMDITRRREVETDKVVQRIISGVEVLEGPTAWPGRFIPLVPVVGEEVHVGRETVTHGLVRFAKDAQRAYNFARTAATESVSLAPKAPYIGTGAMFAGQEAEWKQANRKNKAFLIYTPDPEAPGAEPKRQAAPEIQIAYGQEAALSQQDMNSTTGIYPPALGKPSNEVSGVAVGKRQQEGDVGTFVYVDNLGIAISYGGTILVDLIPRIYDSTRVIRVLGEDDKEDFVKINEPVQNEDGDIVLLNDLSVGKYDVAVTPGPSFSTKREEAASGMVDFIKAAPQTASVVMDLLAKNLDWPGADEMAKRFRKIAVAQRLAEPEEGEEPPEQDPGMLAEAQKAQIEALESQVKALKTQREAEKLVAETSGVELDNAAKALELATETDQFQQAVEIAVGNVIETMVRNAA